MKQIEFYNFEPELSTSCWVW